MTKSTVAVMILGLGILLSVFRPGFGLEAELETFVLPMHPNLIFVKLMITNRSTSDNHDAYFGIWSDDIGTHSSEDIMRTAFITLTQERIGL